MKSNTTQQIVVGVTVWTICQVLLLAAGVILNLLPTIHLSDVSTVTPYVITLMISLSATAFILYVIKRRQRVYNSNYRMAYASQAMPSSISRPR